jgi:beta-glucosidase
VQIGRSSADVVAEATVILVGDDVVPELTLTSSVAEWFEHPVVGARLLEGFLAALPGDAAENHGSLLQMIGSMGEGGAGEPLMLRPRDSATRER